MKSPCPITDPYACPVCGRYDGVQRGPNDEVLNTWADTADSILWIEDHEAAGIDLIFE